ncbi:AAA family ATPase [Rathayibacter sp. AY1D4]|uniref:AAA family ATPase n=1 Tax=Rathayibacter sp. AY1D4 TaxID=2080545 RepID=UPI000CE83A43|nr:ATP-binding protein [Rathayibacter sp. AY1D4]PPH70524.1 AAA family ATPase [Rathayibacter sp. AY1D4]
MAASGEHVKALVRSHASGDDTAFYSVAMQVAAQAARQGHSRLASDIKHVIDQAREEPVVQNVTSIAKPRGDLAELVHATFPKSTLKEFVGPSQLLEQIQLVIREQMQRSKLFEHGFAPTHRLLLEGPPGTGKTLTAGVIAHQLSLPLLTVRLDGLLSKYMGETAGKLRTVFDAVNSQRAVYLFDEFDALGADRAGNDVGEARRILNSFLVFLEEASAESVVIAATNHRGILDPALFRRFDQVISYDLPDATQASKILRTRLGALGKGIRWGSVAAKAQGLSHAELVKAAESAAKVSLLRGGDIVTTAELVNAVEIRRLASHG